MYVTNTDYDYNSLVVDLKGRAYYDEPLRHHTTLRIGGTASLYYEPEMLSSMIGLIKQAREMEIPLCVMGGGSNLLFGDEGFDGIVISTRRLNTLEWLLKEDVLTLRVTAGVSLSKLLSFAIKTSVAGLEGLAGIRVPLGGAIAGNAGSFGFEIKDVIKHITFLNDAGELTKLARDQIPFAYRHCGLTQNSFIVEANFELLRGNPSEIEERYNTCLLQKKRSQPVNELSAGCVFRNPSGRFAGKLIDLSGCKGDREGDIEVSSKHANFFVNKGRGTARDFIVLMERVQSSVRDHFGIELEPEIKIVNTSRI